MEIAAAIVYLKNRSSTRSLKGKTPYEALFGRKPDLSHLRILGTPTYIHIPEEKRVKLDSHSYVGQLISYEDTTNQYQVWDHIRKDVVVARDIVFDESLLASQPAILTSESAVLDEIKVLPASTFSASSPMLSDDSAAITITTAAPIDETNESIEEGYISTASGMYTSDIIEGPRRGKGQRALRYDQIDWSKLATKKTARLARKAPISKPQLFTEAVNHPEHSKQWKQAILNEYNSLIKNMT